MIMDEKLQQQQRRKGGFLQFLELQQRNVMRKTSPHQKHKDGSSKSPKSKHTSTSPPMEENYNANKDANHLLKTIVHGTGKIAHTGMRTLIGKKKVKGNQQKLSPLPLETQLPRTISIHRLNNDGSTPPKDLTSLNDKKMTPISLDQKSSPYYQPKVAISSKPSESISEKQHGVCDNTMVKKEIGRHQTNNKLEEDQSGKRVLTSQSLEETNRHLPKQRNNNAQRSEGDEAGYPQKEFTDMIRLFNANMESLLKIAQDPNFAYCLESQEVRSSIQKLAKLLSLPTNLGLISPNQNVEENLNKNSQESNPNNTIADQPKPTRFDTSSASSSAEPNNPNNTKNASKGFSVLRKKIKEIVKENKKEHRMISMDGILHKVPYGQKSFKNAGNDLEDHLNGKDDRCILRSKSGKFGSAKELTKSPSLHESLDKYSLLMKSYTRQESQKLPQISKVVKEQNSAQSTNIQRSLQKTLSLPEISLYDANISKNAEVSNAQRPEKLEPSSSSMSSRAMMLPNGFSQLKKVASFTTHSDVDVKCSIKEEAKQTILQDQEQESSLQEQKLVSNTMLNDADEGDIQEIDYEQDMGLNRKAQYLIKEDDSGEASKKIQEQSMPPGNLDLSTNEDDDYFFSDEDMFELSEDKISLNPTNDSLLEEGSKPKPLQEHIQHDQIVIPENHFSMDAYIWTENAKEEFDEKQTSTILDGWNYFRIQVDEKYENEFQYVKDILLKSGFCSENALGEWYSPNQPISPLLFEEIEYSYHDLEGSKEVDTTLYHMLLFDLINEVLIEIYDASFSYYSFLIHVDKIRPLPVGYHVLEEVWADISRYLNAQFQIDQAVESIVARDFMKNDGWMNLQHDTELVGLELEDVIVDELIDEVVHLYGLPLYY